MRKKINGLLMFSWMIALSFTARSADTRSDSIDIIHTNISLDFSAFSTKVMTGIADVTFKPKFAGIHRINLDLLLLSVDSVKTGSNQLSYTYNDTLLSIDLGTVGAIGVDQVVSIYYHGTPIQPVGDFGGFYWTSQYAFNIGVSFLSDPHNFGRVWFPCFDNFVERCTYSFSIATDSTRSAFCNGHLDSVTNPIQNNKVWHWSMKDEIPSYLASVAVSDYTPIYDNYIGANGTIPIILAARAIDTSHLRASFVHLKNAISIFETRFGPYVFNRVGYCIVPFTAGAMEHATNISYMLPLVNGNTTYESVMAHELSHHWFGDMATCDKASEMWLNEGWARYCENIFFEGMDGHARYQHEVRVNHEDVIRLAHVIDSAYWPVSGVPSSLTYSSNTIYDKGADRVHTLRGYMGDTAFFSCIRSYLVQYKFRNVNSNKMRDYLASCSGKSYINDFFTDWIWDGGFPHFSIEEKKTVAVGGNFQTSILIRQRGDHTSHLYNNVPLEVSYFDAGGNKIVKTASVSGSCNAFSVTLPFEPVYIALDFDEKISDAITDEWIKVLDAGTYNMGTAKMTINLITGSDSSLIRVEHNWVAPDARMNSIKNLHLSDYRYWTVDGIWPSDFHATATINYNGTANTTSGYLDNNLITNTEDSLVLVYRPDAQAQWQIETDVIWIRGNMTDKIGSIKINDLHKGQYAIGIYQTDKVDSAQAPLICANLGTSEMNADIYGWKVYPNPMANDRMYVELEGNTAYSKCVVTDMKGVVVYERTLVDNQRTFLINLHNAAPGSYAVSLIDKDNRKYSKSIVKPN